jgi:hypothetical protein
VTLGDIEVEIHRSEHIEGVNEWPTSMQHSHRGSDARDLLRLAQAGAAHRRAGDEL